MRRFIDALRDIESALFGDRQRGMPDHRVFLSKESLMAFYEHCASQERCLRQFHEENKKLKAQIERADSLIFDTMMENTNLRAMRDELVAYSESVAIEISSIMNESRGVEGYHQNGAIAHWDEFDLTEALSKSPQKCLNEIRAEAVLSAVKFFAPSRDIDVEALESYAAKVRQGGEA